MPSVLCTLEYCLFMQSVNGARLLNIAFLLTLFAAAAAAAVYFSMIKKPQAVFTTFKFLKTCKFLLTFLLVFLLIFLAKDKNP